MSSVLFHPETSIRRALVMALGHYPIDHLPPDERARLVDDLAALHRDDADAGIHGAVEWTLREWGKADRLETSGARSIDDNSRGNRRWFGNRDGLTFSVVDGPVEFAIGSPPTEPNHNSDTERQREIVVPRRFAIS